MRDNDPLLHALGDLAREQDPVEDPRLDALAADTLTREQQEELRARDDDPMADAVLEAFRPIDDVAKERFVDAILAQSEQREAPNNVVPMRAKRAWLAGAGLLGTLAAAAAIVLMVSSRGPSPLPPYDLVVIGGESGVRSLPALPAHGTPKLVRGSQLELRLRPATKTEGPLAFRGALKRDAEILPWAPAIQSAPDGAARISGTKESLFPGIPAGKWTVVIGIGRPDVLPSDPTELVALEASDDPVGARLHHVTIELTDD